MVRVYGVLWSLILIQGLFANDAATRFQQAIEKHGGEAYRALAERGVKLTTTSPASTAARALPNKSCGFGVISA